MNIFPISIINTQNVHHANLNKRTDKHVTTPKLSYDTVSFKGVLSGNAPIKKLLQYGIPDLYTDRILLDPKILESLMQRSVFYKPISQLIPIISKYSDTLLPVETEVLNLIKTISEKKPDCKIDDALKLLVPEHQKKLLKKQQPVFEQLIQKACDLPPNLYEEFWDLMNVTNKRIAKEPVIIPFNEKGFIYKLQRIAPIIKAKNIHKENQAINNIIKEAKLIFETQEEDVIKFGRGKKGRKKKLEYQIRPAVLKQNIVKFKYLEELFEKSPLKHNKDLQQIFSQTSARIHGFPAITPFKSKDFLIELKEITKRLKDRELASELTKIARKLPKSTENISAFIVKYANDTPNKIGYFLMRGSMCSVDHLLAKNKGGKDKLFNFGLCGICINTEKTNTNFDEWVRMHPETRIYAQRQIDRYIELYNDGTFDKVGMERSYITDLAEQIEALSPKENPIVLDLSKLKK